MVQDLLKELDGDEIIAVIAILSGAIIACVAIVCAARARTSRLEVESNLKQELIANGMSADDIVKVVKASGVSEVDWSKAHSVKWSSQQA